MKQPKNKFNKCIKRAIKAAYSEREEMEKQRDIWERAISEKDRQIDMLNGMLEVQPLDTPKEDKGEYDSTVEEKFDEVWSEFIKTLPKQYDERLMKSGHRWCKNFYNYKEIETRKYIEETSRHYDVEEYFFTPFIKFLKHNTMLVNGKKIPLRQCVMGYLVNNDNEWIFHDTNFTIQRIRPNS